MSSQDARTLASRLSDPRRKPWQLQTAEFLDESTIEQCLVRAEGNPLYLSQLLRLSGADARNLDGAHSLDALLVQRTARLASKERALLEVAACIGFYFDGERPQTLSGAGPADLEGLM